MGWGGHARQLGQEKNTYSVERGWQVALAQKCHGTDWNLHLLDKQEAGMVHGTGGWISDTVLPVSVPWGLPGKED